MIRLLSIRLYVGGKKNSFGCVKFFLSFYLRKADDKIRGKTHSLISKLYKNQTSNQFKRLQFPAIIFYSDWSGNLAVNELPVSSWLGPLKLWKGLICYWMFLQQHITAAPRLCVLRDNWRPPPLPGAASLLAAFMRLQRSPLQGVTPFLPSLFALLLPKGAAALQVLNTNMWLSSGRESRAFACTEYYIFTHAHLGEYFSNAFSFELYFHFVCCLFLCLFHCILLFRLLFF